MKQTSNGYVQEGYCEDASLGHYRVFSLTTCSNKAKYKVTFDNGNVKNICGTHLRQYYKVNYRTDEVLKGQFIQTITKVEEIKTGKVIYEKR